VVQNKKPSNETFLGTTGLSIIDNPESVGEVVCAVIGDNFSIHLLSSSILATFNIHNSENYCLKH
jgi:hypothetical protein